MTYSRKVRRKKKVSCALRSPFIVRRVEIGKNLTKEEKLIWKYIEDGVPCVRNSEEVEAVGLEEHSELGRNKQKGKQVMATSFVEELFKTRYNLESKLFYMVTLEPKQPIDCNVINCFAAVLNYEERNKDPNSPYRLFGHAIDIENWIVNASDGGVERMVEFLERIIIDVVEGSMGLLDLKPFDLVMLPVLEKGHYFLDDYEFQKKDTPLKVKNVFVEYLKRVCNTKWKYLEKAITVKPKIDWAMKNNTEDSGLFVMRHMETFMGDCANWTCGISVNARAKTKQINSLRKKYAAKILLSEVNILKEKVKKELENLES